MRTRRALKCSAVTFLFAVMVMTLSTLHVLAADPWLPITKEDLELKSVPESRGAHAVILYRSVEHNDPQGFEEHYVRIKILTQEGTKYGNVETPSTVQDVSFIDDIKARTIKPDGTIVPFAGKVFEKVIAKKKSFKQVAKTFTMPEVQVGSIIEYRFKERFDTVTGMINGTEWKVQDDLFTKKAKFVFRQGPVLPVQWVYSRLGPGIAPAKQKDGSIMLTVENVPAFETEKYMPPEAEVRQRVYFYYVPEDSPKTAEEYWKKKGEEWKKDAEKFMDKRSAMQKEVALVLKPEDTTPEAKMRRLYTRVQQIRNRTWERDKTEKEQQKENLKDNNNVEDVLKHGYAYHSSINKLYVALLRAAGIQATLMRLGERDDSFLHKNIPIWDQLTWDIAVAKDSAKEYFLDPGTLYCRFGELAWEDTEVEGWRADTMTWGKVPPPAPGQTLETHKAVLDMDRDGTLTGTLQVSFSGMAALSRRLSSREDDDTEKKKDFEDLVKGWLPAGSKVDLVKMDGWTNAEVPLTADFNITVYGLGASTGKRLLLPTSIFQGQDRHPFQHSTRMHPVYLHFPFHDVDEVTINLPEGLQLEAPPAPQQLSIGMAAYVSKMVQEGRSLKVRRDLVINGVYFPVEQYGQLQGFYNKVSVGDTEQAVLKIGGAANAVAK